MYNKFIDDWNKYVYENYFLRVAKYLQNICKIYIYLSKYEVCNIREVDNVIRLLR